MTVWGRREGKGFPLPALRQALWVQEPLSAALLQSSLFCFVTAVKAASLLSPPLCLHSDT